MKTTINVPTVIEVKTLLMTLHVRYGDEDVPADFPHRHGDRWTVEIDIDTGQIANWPVGWPFDLYMKVCDEGAYSLLDPDRGCITTLEDYVPHGLVPGDYGDYVDLKIDASGKITNWPAVKDIDLSAFDGFGVGGAP